MSVTLRLHAYPCDLLSDATNARVQAIALKQLEFLVDALLDDYEGFMVGLRPLNGGVWCCKLGLPAEVQSAPQPPVAVQAWAAR